MFINYYFAHNFISLTNKSERKHKMVSIEFLSPNAFNFKSAKWLIFYTD